MSSAPAPRGKLQTVPTEQVQPNSWNPNQQSPYVFQRQLESIRQHGFLDPIIVRRLKAKQYEILDGEHRWRAAVELKMQEIPVWDLGAVEEAEARRLTEVFIHLHGQPDLMKEADLLAELTGTFGVSTEDLLSTIPLTETQLDSLIQASSFSWDELPETPEPTAPKGDATEPMTEPTIGLSAAPEGAGPVVPTVVGTPQDGASEYLLLRGFSVAERARVLEVFERVAPGDPAAALLELIRLYEDTFAPLVDDWVEGEEAQEE